MIVFKAAMVGQVMSVSAWLVVSVEFNTGSGGSGEIASAHSCMLDADSVKTNTASSDSRFPVV